LVAQAQPPVKVIRIGVLTATKPEASNLWEGFVRAFSSKRAKALGLTIPQSLLTRADEVIQ
jgi:hypothetical protein